MNMKSRLDSFLHGLRRQCVENTLSRGLLVACSHIGCKSGRIGIGASFVESVSGRTIPLLVHADGGDGPICWFCYQQIGGPVVAYADWLVREHGFVRGKDIPEFGDLPAVAAKVVEQRPAPAVKPVEAPKAPSVPRVQVPAVRRVQAAVPASPVPCIPRVAAPKVASKDEAKALAQRTLPLRRAVAQAPVVGKVLAPPVPCVPAPPVRVPEVMVPAPAPRRTESVAWPVVPAPKVPVRITPSVPAPKVAPRVEAKAPAPKTIPPRRTASAAAPLVANHVVAPPLAPKLRREAGKTANARRSGGRTDKFGQPIVAESMAEALRGLDLWPQGHAEQAAADAFEAKVLAAGQWSVSPTAVKPLPKWSDRVPSDQRRALFQLNRALVFDDELAGTEFGKTLSNAVVSSSTWEDPWEVARRIAESRVASAAA
jgi:hypothetical protein